MKTRQLILTVMITVICCSAVAQSHIDKVVDEIEQKGVDVSKVVKRDPKTKKAYSIVKSLTFYSKDGNYANRLKEAFQKDAEDATEEKVEKKGNHYLLVFINGKKKTTYTLNIQEQQEKNPRVDLKIIMRDGNVKEIDKYDDLMNVIGTKGIQFRRLEGLEGLDYFDWNKYTPNNNMVEIKGAIRRPGRYELKTVTTVRSLIEQAGGLTEDAIIASSVMYRMNGEQTLEKQSVDIAGIMAGTVADVPLKNKDILFIPTQNEPVTANIGTFLVRYGREYSDQDLDEIIQYGINSGISQAKIVTELLQRGVKIDQIRRVRAQLEEKQKVKASEKAKREAIDNQKQKVIEKGKQNKQS